MKLRFAPSPTGNLHVGNVRAALVNWLFARKHGGTFLLRMDDTDGERSRKEYETGIMQDLSWLGLNWDGDLIRQSERFDRYKEAMQFLVEKGRLYPCYETAEELDFKRKIQAGRGQSPMYDRAALQLTDAQKAAFEAEGRKPHWRFKLNDEVNAWDDLVRGHCEFKGQHVSDPVLIRADGIPLYTFASVIDDGDMDITHIVRGEDHVSNSAVQIQIFEAMGFKVPTFAHMALLTSKGGKLSKREGGGDIRSLREEGFLPIAITSYLANIGTSHAIELADSLDTLVQAFDFAHLGRAAAQYDEDELARLNTKRIHQMDVTEATERTGISLDESFWLAVRENLTSIKEVKDWMDLVNQPITPEITDADYLKQAAELLPQGEWDATSWQHFTNAVKEATGRKGKDLFMPLRLALTARHDGPDLNKVFYLLGREKAQKRLLGEAA
jgi:glutamyl-tRNA synthetase